jgi:hypothetical protein
MRGDERDITKRGMSMNLDGHPSRSTLEKMDSVKDDMRIKTLSMEMMSDI